MNLPISEPIGTVPRATDAYMGRTSVRTTLVDSLTTLNRPSETSREASNLNNDEGFIQDENIPVSHEGFIQDENIPVSHLDRNFVQDENIPVSHLDRNFGRTSTRAVIESGPLRESGSLIESGPLIESEQNFSEETAIGRTSTRTVMESGPLIESGPLMESGPLIESGGVPDGVREPELDQNVPEEAARQDIPLLDFEPEHMGNLAAIQNSIAFIPSKFIRRLRLLWIKYLQRALDTDEVMDWKKYFLLPVILFDSGAASSSSDLKKNMSQRITLLEVDNWDSFTFLSLSIRKDNVHQQGSEDKLYALAKKFAKAGELSKALKVLLRSNSEEMQVEGIEEKLRSKFPAPTGDDLVDMEALLRHQLSDDVERIEVPVEKVVFVVGNLKRMVKCGFDKMRHEHLKDLFGKTFQANPEEAEFRTIYTKLINRLINGEIPATVLPLFRDIEVVAIPKKGNDIRPIGINTLDRKIAAAASNLVLKDLSREHFKGLQFCMEKNGCEKIVHLFRVGIEQNPDYDTFLMDGENAFNRLCRAAALKEVRDHFPAGFPFLRAIYGVASSAWHHGGENNMHLIESTEGVHQGCKSAMWLYGVGTMPFLHGLKDILGPVGFLSFFADDGNLHTTFEKMVACVKYVVEEGPKFGYFLKRDKGTYLLGRCQSPEEAQRRRRVLIEELDISPDVIRVHPSNVDFDIEEER